MNKHIKRFKVGGIIVLWICLGVVGTVGTLALVLKYLGGWGFLVLVLLGLSYVVGQDMESPRSKTRGPYR